MFSDQWKDLTIRAKEPENREESSSCRAALAACLALARREETIRAGEQNALLTEGLVPTLHHGYRRKLEHLAEYCVGQYPARHLPFLWRVLMRSAYLRGDTKRCRALFYRAVRDCPWSKVKCC